MLQGPIEATSALSQAQAGIHQALRRTSESKGGEIATAAVEQGTQGTALALVEVIEGEELKALASAVSQSGMPENDSGASQNSHALAA